MNTIGVTLLATIVFAVIAAKRRWALVALLAAVLYLPQQQQIEIAGFNMYAMRFVELAGFARVIAKKEFTPSHICSIDRAFIALYSYTIIVFLMRSDTDQAYQIGLAVDAFLCYFTFRGLIPDLTNHHWLLRTFIFLLAPYATLVVFEGLTGHNLFIILGAEQHIGNYIRDGRVRCFGSFRHPSLLGTLGASFLPLYIGILCNRHDRVVGAIGAMASLAIVWASNSGGPLSCIAVATVGWLFWRTRRNMHRVRQLLVASLVLVAVFMKAPIWYLPAKLSGISGGDGYHRSHLMDMAAQTVTDWGLWGMPRTATANWFPYSLVTGEADMTNQYLQFGIAAGLGAVVLLIILLKRSFSKLGTAMLEFRSTSSGGVRSELLLWGMGVMLLVHCTNWLTISYFDQTHVIWYMQIATIASTTTVCLSTSALDSHKLIHQPSVSIMT